MFSFNTTWKYRFFSSPAENPRKYLIFAEKNLTKELVILAIFFLQNVPTMVCEGVVSGRMIGNTFLGVLLGCTSPQLAFFMIFDAFAALLNERERGPEKREKYVGYETDFFIFFSYII